MGAEVSLGARKTMVAGALFLAQLALAAQSGESVTTYDEEISVLKFEPLIFPIGARVRHVQGVVVVRASLDANGNVLEASAISGAKALVPDCLATSSIGYSDPTNAERSL
jgi:outer membrane biosynthesis protein TonB